MSLQGLKEHLSSYIPTEPDEDKKVVSRFANLIDQKAEKCLVRSTFDPGHIVASGLVVDPKERQILLNHHKSLGFWLAFGGHLDGESNAELGARREVAEESGIQNPKLLSSDIVDLDIHKIPTNPDKQEPEHLHYDIGFIYQASVNDNILLSDESVVLKWVAFEEAPKIAYTGSMKRFIKKAIQFIDS